MPLGFNINYYLCDLEQLSELPCESILLTHQFLKVYYYEISVPSNAEMLLDEYLPSLNKDYLDSCSLDFMNAHLHTNRIYIQT